MFKTKHMSVDGTRVSPRVGNIQGGEWHGG